MEVCTGRVIPLTDGCRAHPQNTYRAGDLRAYVSALSMTQLIFGAALGFLLGEGVLHGLKQSIGCSSATKCVNGLVSFVRARNRAHRRFHQVCGCNRGDRALITLGVWGVGDYLAAKSVHRAMSANTSDGGRGGLLTGSAWLSERGYADRFAASGNSATAVRVDNVAPYADPAFKVQRRPQHAATSLSADSGAAVRSKSPGRRDCNPTRASLHDLHWSTCTDVPSPCGRV